MANSSVIERSMEEARVTQQDMVRRVSESLRASGWPPYTAHVTRKEALSYYASQLFDPATGQVNPQAVAALVGTAENDFRDGRIGPHQYAELVKAMGDDFKQQLKEQGG